MPGDRVHSHPAWLAWLDRALMLLASLSIFGIMAIVSSDVFLRYFFNRPLSWGYDAVSLYLIGAVFFFALPGTFSSRGHVSIELVADRFGFATRRRLTAFWSLASAVAFGLVFWLGLERTLGAWRAGEVVAGAVAWPVWLSLAVVPLGCGVLLLRLLANMLWPAVPAGLGEER